MSTEAQNAFQRRKSKKIVNRPSSPLEMEFNWYTEDGVWRYKARGEDLRDRLNLKHTTGNARNLKGVILEPALACIEGQNKEGTWRVVSNLTMNTVMDIFYIQRFRKERGSNENQLLGVGEWTGDLKAKVTSADYQGKWHKTVAIYILECEVREYNPEKEENVGKWKTIRPDCIALLKMRGWGNKLGWKASCDEAGLDPMNLTACTFSHTENYVQAKGTVKIQKVDWFYPSFSFTDFKDLPAKVMNPIFAKAEPAMETFQDFLEEHLNFYEKKALASGEYEGPDPEEDEEDVPGEEDVKVPKKRVQRGGAKSKTQAKLDEAEKVKKGKEAVTKVMTEDEDPEDEEGEEEQTDAEFAEENDLPF